MVNHRRQRRPATVVLPVTVTSQLIEAKAVRSAEATAAGLVEGRTRTTLGLTSE